MAKVKVDIKEYASFQPTIIQEWIANVDKIMTDCGCRVDSAVVSNSKRTDGKFIYTSKKLRKQFASSIWGLLVAILRYAVTISYIPTVQETY